MGGEGVGTREEAWSERKEAIPAPEKYVREREFFFACLSATSFHLGRARVSCRRPTVLRRGDTLAYVLVRTM